MKQFLTPIGGIFNQLLIVLRYIKSYLSQIFFHLREVVEEAFWRRYLRIDFELLLPVATFFVIIFLLNFLRFHAAAGRFSSPLFIDVGINL